jgi:hypothetical protein
MKKIIGLMLGLSLLCGAAAVDAPTDTEKDGKAKKKAATKKAKKTTTSRVTVGHASQPS